MANICQNFAGICQKSKAWAKCTVTPAGSRSLHFRGGRPVPRLPELANSSARPPWLRVLLAELTVVVGVEMLEILLRRLDHGETENIHSRLTVPAYFF